MTILVGVSEDYYGQSHCWQSFAAAGALGAESFSREVVAVVGKGQPSFAARACEVGFHGQEQGLNAMH